MPYQLTALLCNAQRQTGIGFEIDSELDSGEFTIVGDGKIEKFLINPSDPWDTVILLMSLLHIAESFWLSLITLVPGIRWFAMVIVGRQIAKTLL